MTTPQLTAPEEVATDTPASIAPSSDSKRKITAKKHVTSVQVDISNKTSLSEISKRYRPDEPAPEAPQPPRKSTYFEKLDMAIRMELDHGTQHIIDVQPDLRFPFQYFIYDIAERYPELTVKSHPYTSTFTLIAYNQILFNAYLLICDLYSRENPSVYAQCFKNDAAKADLLTKLLACYVPTTIEPLFNSLAPTYDPQRKLQLYVPTLAGFDFILDFGRSVPPSMLILAHHLLASIRTNSDPETVLRTFYSTTILTVDNTNFTPANFLGGYFDVNQRPTSHTNWLNARFEKIFNPVVGRALIQRPTLAKARFVVPEFIGVESVDPYEFLLAYSQDNLEKLFEILSDVSSFIKEENPSCKQLGQVLENSSGITIMYHSLWSTTLPTCHLLSPPTVTCPNETEEMNDTQYAKLIRFLVSGPTFKSKLTPPAPDIDKVFYLVDKDPYDSDIPLSNMTFLIKPNTLHLTSYGFNHTPRTPAH